MDNTRIAEYLCLYAIGCGAAPYCPHLFFTRFLSDADKSERCLGMDCGIAFMQVCDEIWIYTAKGISEGMESEIAIANDRGMTMINIAKLTDTGVEWSKYEP